MMKLTMNMKQVYRITDLRILCEGMMMYILHQASSFATGTQYNYNGITKQKKSLMWKNNFQQNSLALTYLIFIFIFKCFSDLNSAYKF